MAKLDSLETLIRLRKRELDSLRQRMNVLEDQRQQFIKKLAEFQEELERERQATTLAMSGFFGAYAKRNQDQQKSYKLAIKRLEGQIEELRDMVQRSFSELKKLELAQEQEIQRQKKEQLHKETAFLDELGLQAFRRVQKDKE